jgi:hypothetical protein
LAFSLFVHSRARFLFNLLPQLQKATSLRRVVSVGAATCEGAIDLNNMTGQGFHFLKIRDQVASMGTLILEEAAKRAPDVSFIHDVPGIVKSGISRDAEGLKMQLIVAVTSFLLGPFLQTPVAECGERHVFLATSAKFLPRTNPRISAGVGMDESLSAARGTDGKPGTGVYSVDNKGESAPSRVETLLAQFREEGTAQKVIDYLFSDFRRITGTETATE